MPEELGDPLGAAGTCPTVRWKGKDWKLGKPTQAAKDRFSVGIVECHKRGMREALKSGLYTKDEYHERMEHLARRIAAPRLEHKVGKPLWLEYVAGAEMAMGNVVFLWSLFAENHPELTLDDVVAMGDECPAEIKVAMAVSVPSFLSWACEAVGRPEMIPEVTAAATKALASAGFGIAGSTTT